MDVKIESGPVEVIASGTVIAFDHQPIEISVGPPTDCLKIVIVFTTDKPPRELPLPTPPTPYPIPMPGQLPFPAMPKPNKVNYEVVDSQTLRITFRNINAPAGYGTVKAFRIGTIEGKPVHMQYRLYDLGGTSDKMFHYTLYRDKE